MSEHDSSHPKLSPESVVPSDVLERAFPGGFTVRDEANALTAFAFRNGPLENLHAGKSSPLTSDPNLSRITNEEMKQLMMDASAKLEKMLKLRDADPAGYRAFLQRYAIIYCRSWLRSTEPK